MVRILKSMRLRWAGNAAQMGRTVHSEFWWADLLVNDRLEERKADGFKEILLRRVMDGNGLGSCPAADFNINGVDTSGFSTGYMDGWIKKYINKHEGRLQSSWTNIILQV
jgi:hypothetical protein